MPAIVFSSDPEQEAAPSVVAVADSEFSCPQCGSPITEDDVFCGECGFVLASSYLSAPVDAVGEVRSTAPAEVGPPAAEEGAPAAEALDDEVIDTGEITGVSGWVAVASDPASEIELVAPAADERPADAAPPVVESEPEPVLVVEPEPEPVVEPEPEPVVEPELEPAAPQPRVLRSAPDPFPWGKDPRLPTVDLEATRVSAAPLAEERFVLQFSTGESITVSGAGLVGRNPASQPGEFVDQLVTIFDAGKSVSKTHLEFGQDSGRFWVSDRYSTNGSTVRQPDAEPKRCEPGRRYFVARGTRVDIGEQFFVVS